MEDEKIQNTQDLFHGAKVAKLVSYQRLELEYIKECIFVCTKILFKCEITTIIAGNFETILRVNVT